MKDYFDFLGLDCWGSIGFGLERMRRIAPKKFVEACFPSTNSATSLGRPPMEFSFCTKIIY